MQPQVPHAPAPSQASPAWRLQLLGGLRARHAERGDTHFSSRGAGALLARLALYPRRGHAREELIELLWPGVAIEVGRNRLRQALFTLRQSLEPPGGAPVVVADRQTVRLIEGAIEADAHRFEAALREGEPALAVSLYAGELLPGFYDEWIVEERRRFAALFERANDAVAATETAPGALAPPAATTDDTTPATIDRSTHAEVGRGSLPVYLTRFFGRDADGARLRAEVLSHRLVTLLGPGGGGKTRLAVELAAAFGAASPARAAPGRAFDFVAFVPLVTCATRAQVLDALIASLHLRPLGDDPFEPLIAALSGRRALLVLDNFEQLTGIAEDVVARLTTLIPELHVLVTSRRVLGLDGEREFAIQPLALPRRGLPLNEAAINPAVALFADRARAARADFQLAPANLEPVIELVHLLEGMPLAIELAAARVRAIAPSTMAGLLRAARGGPPGHALELLHRGGPRSGVDQRHASMLAVIEWSWRLLEPAQQRLLAALTVFHGGFDAAAAQAVCAEGRGLVGVRLDELVSHSLLRAAETESGVMRFSTFEPVREYAALQLDPATAPALRARHRAWLTAWANALPATPSLAELRAEMPNVLAALANAVDETADATAARTAAEEAIRMVLPLGRVLEDVELPAEGLLSLAAAIEHCADPALQSQGHALLAPLLFLAGRAAEALRHARAGLDGAPPGSPQRGRALYALARVRWRIDRDPRGLPALIDEAQVLADAAGDVELRASLLALRAFIANATGERAAGEGLLQRALALWRETGNQHAINSGRYHLAVAAQNAGRHAETLERLAELEPATRDLQDWRRLSQLLNVRGNAQSELRRWRDAVASFRGCIQLGLDCLALHELAYGLWNLPRALAHIREPEAALQLAAFASQFWRTRFGPLSAADHHDLRRVRRLAARQLDARRREQLWSQGERLSLTEAMALTLRGASGLH